MNTTLVFILCITLFGLAVIYTIVTQHKNRTENTLRKKKARSIAQYEATYALVIEPQPFPFSHTLLLCLHLNMLNSLQTLFKLDPDDPSIPPKIKEAQKKIIDIQNHSNHIEKTTFHAPNEDQQAIKLLKLVKKLKNIVNIEYKKGHLNPEAFHAESTRLEQIKIKVNIANVRKRIAEAQEKNQLDTAEQLIARAIEILDSNSDPYCNQVKKELMKQQQEIVNSLAAKFDLSWDNAKNDDSLFESKKKW